MTHKVEPYAKGLVVQGTLKPRIRAEPVQRLKIVRVRVKREPERIDITKKLQDEKFARAEVLYAYWEATFMTAFGVEYVPKSRPADLASMDDVIDDVGDTVKIERMIHLLLTHDELLWVTNKTVAWFAKPRNRTFIAPLMVIRKRTAEFSGHRTQTTKITFRGN